jgi:hypothetical protein
MTDAVAAQESLEAMPKGEIVRMDQEVADNPDGEYHFFHGRQAAEPFGHAAATGTTMECHEGRLADIVNDPQPWAS